MGGIEPPTFCLQAWVPTNYAKFGWPAHPYKSVCYIATPTRPPKSKIQNPRSKIQNPRSKIQTPKSKLQTPNSKDLGFWILDFGSWILDLGFWILDFGFWILDRGFCERFGLCIRLLQADFPINQTFRGQSLG